MMNSRIKFWFMLLLFAAILVVGTVGVAEAMTIATFDDPAADGTTPLFTVDLVSDLISGGWDDSQTNLNLDIGGAIYSDAFFTMTAVSYTGGTAGGPTSAGIIKFFADGQSTSTTPLIQIDFDSAQVTPLGFGAMDSFFGDSVVISGSEITGTLWDECFSFAFANHQPIDGSWDNGFDVTAGFTCSAVPEPATIALLGIGWLITITRKSRFF